MTCTLWNVLLFWLDKGRHLMKERIEMARKILFATSIFGLENWNPLIHAYGRLNFLPAKFVPHSYCRVSEVNFLRTEFLAFQNQTFESLEILHISSAPLLENHFPPFSTGVGWLRKRRQNNFHLICIIQNSLRMLRLISNGCDARNVIRFLSMYYSSSSQGPQIQDLLWHSKLASTSILYDK